mgnify:CR=1 FL=1
MPDLISFEKKVDDTYEKELKDRTSLIEQIKSLEKLNLQMSEEAQNLTKALKGDNKAQGNWGELILEKVLESSGLVKDVEYATQYSTITDEGNRVQPDVIINLPEEKHIIVDSKVSLVAYQNYINAENDVERDVHLKNHVLSVKTHIKGLSEKHYVTAKGIDTPDFVLLFMPIESSFGLAMKADNELYQYAWDSDLSQSPGSDPQYSGSDWPYVLQPPIDDPDYANVTRGVTCSFDCTSLVIGFKGQNLLIGRKSKKSYKVGDEIEVKIIKVDILKYQIDLELT